MRFSARAFVFTLSFAVLLVMQPLPSAFAQGYSSLETTQTYDPNYVDPEVPVNQHTRVQLLVVDILSAVICQIGGIDPVNPKNPCIAFDPTTKKFGYSAVNYDEEGNPRIGGLLGATSNMIGLMYTPTISTNDYTQYLAQNFGIVKPAYAQEAGYGFQGLQPLLMLWTAVRNVAYFLLMVAFVIIGLGIMLRVKVDPRSVMTLQNQIPRIIISIILVTFSYAIAGLMIDTMWLSTYVGINVITSAGANTNNLLGTQTPLAELATKNLLEDPLGFVNAVFSTGDSDGINSSGIWHITSQVSSGLGAFLEELIRGFLGVTTNDSCAGWTGINFAACVAGVFGFIASWLLIAIILVVVVRLLFTVWFTLLKAYTFIIFFTIGAPIFIVLGLLPGKPYGIEKWLRSMTANLAVFPATVWNFMIARLFMDLFQTSGPNQFIPPLVFQPNIGIWGVMLAFGVFLMTPTLLSMLQESLKVPGTKYGSAIGAGIAMGAQMPKAVGGAFWRQATHKGKLHEYDPGWLRQWAAGSKPVVNQSLVGQKGYPGRVVNTIRKWRSKLYSIDSKGNRSGGGH